MKFATIAKVGKLSCQHSNPIAWLKHLSSDWNENLQVENVGLGMFLWQKELWEEKSIFEDVSVF